MANESINKYHFESLSTENIKCALSMLNSCFMHDGQDDFRKDCLYSSLEKNKYTDFLAECNIQDLHYWLLIENQTSRISGFTGLYTQTKNPVNEDITAQSAWLGWMGVPPVLQGRGIGKILLSEMIEKARLAAKKYLMVYSGDNEVERTRAHKLYKRFSFIEISKGLQSGQPVIFFKLTL